MEPETKELYSFTLNREDRVVIRGRASVIDDRLYAVFDGPIEEMLDKLAICAAHLVCVMEKNRGAESGRLRGFYQNEEEE